MRYRVTKGPIGTRKVKFDCPTCTTELESTLESAGERYPCPVCGAEIVTPGLPELEHQKAAAKAIEDKIRRAEKMRREADEWARLRAAQADAAVRKARATQPPPEPVEQFSKCGNCGGTIGKLERGRFFKGVEVCATCNARLDRSDRTLRMRLVFLFLSIIYPPFFIVWLVLGIVEKSRSR